MSRATSRPAALVVGGSGGIGLATARRLACEGHPLTLAARDPGRLADAADALAAVGPRPRTAEVDVTDETSVRALVEGLEAPAEIVVNAAGKNLSRRLLSPPGTGSALWRRHSLEEWQDTVDRELTGTFLLARESAHALLSAGRPGVFVAITSCTAPGAWGQAAYAASKAAIGSALRSWALELGEHGLRFVGVAPGVVDGLALRSKTAQRPGHASYMERLRAHIPLGRFAHEEEVADAVVYAARATYVTGTVLDVHGGGFPARVH